MSAKDELLIHADQTNKWLRSPHSLFGLICLICVYLWPNGFFHSFYRAMVLTSLPLRVVMRIVEPHAAAEKAQS